MDLHCKTYFSVFYGNVCSLPNRIRWLIGFAKPLEGCTFARANGSQPVYLNAGI